MIMVMIMGSAATAALAMAWAAARSPLGRAVTIGMRCVGNAAHADLH